MIYEELDENSGAIRMLPDEDSIEIERLSREIEELREEIRELRDRIFSLER